MFKSNCHTHTVFCDGKNTAEEMTIAAIKKDFISLGFSSHSPMIRENYWGLKKENVSNYIKEINSLKDKYKNKIDILCGIELDSEYCDVNIDDFDFTIGSVHRFYFEDEVCELDYSPEALTNCVKKHFHGNWTEMSRRYYDDVSDFILNNKVDIVGHLDLITKFNEGSLLFNESDKEYQKIVKGTIKNIISEKPEIVFEINTGAMFRCGRSSPYPAEFAVKYINELGGKLTITSDAHCKEALDYGFDKMIEFCRYCNVEKVYFLTSQGFKEYQIKG